MKVIPLTQGLFVQVSDVDYEHVFNFGKWYAVKNKYNFYAATMFNGKCLFMHNLLMNSVGKVDHADRNGLNNQRENLRFATSSQQNINKRIPRNNTSGYKGVSLFKATGKWHAQLGVNGKRKHIGFFTNVKNAALAYNKAATEHFGEFANLNVVSNN